MTWSTVAGLFAITLLVTVASRWWSALCRRWDNRQLEEAISAKKSQIKEALHADPDNIILHNALRRDLQRLLALRRSRLADR